MGVLVARAISLPQPPYPQLAKQIRIQGAVTVQILVDEQGRGDFSPSRFRSPHLPFGSEGSSTARTLHSDHAQRPGGEGAGSDYLQLCVAVKRFDPIRPNSLYLKFHLALRWLLIRTPAQELCAVAEAAAGEVIVLDFDDQLWRERFPLG